MADKNKIIEESESLIDLLTEQCNDLERLLSLAREETNAAEQRDFGAIMNIILERSNLGDRLEVFQQRISDIRYNLKNERMPDGTRELTSRIVSLANLTLIQDKTTKKLLAESQEADGEEVQKLGKAKRGTVAYNYVSARGIKYDKVF